jgi:hypothetical protein
MNAASAPATKPRQSPPGRRVVSRTSTPKLAWFYSAPMPWFYSAVDRPTLPPGLQAGAYSQADASPWRLWWGMNYLKAGSWELNCHRTAVVLRSTISALAQVNCFPFGARRAGLTRTIHVYCSCRFRTAGACLNAHRPRFSRENHKRPPPMANCVGPVDGIGGNDLHLEYFSQARSGGP